MQKGRRQLRDELGYDTFHPIGLTLFKINKRIRVPMKLSVPGALVGGDGLLLRQDCHLADQVAQRPLCPCGSHLLPRDGGRVLPADHRP